MSRPVECVGDLPSLNPAAARTLMAIIRAAVEVGDVPRGEDTSVSGPTVGDRLRLVHRDVA